MSSPIATFPNSLWLYFSEDPRPEMLLYLAGNNKLVTDTRLNDGDVDILYKTLRNNTFVTSLDLRYNNITDEGAKKLAALIEVRSMPEIYNCSNA